jgi:transposase-like protein
MSGIISSTDKGAKAMISDSPFKWRHFEGQIILLGVRWYLRYCLSYQDLEEMMAERGLNLDHTTIYRWVQKYAPELEKRCKPHLKRTNDSWRVDETYIKVKGEWMYLYRAVDSAGNTLEFLLSENRDTQGAKRFLARALDASHTIPRVINVDRNPVYPKAVDELKAEGQLPQGCQLRPVKYLNNLIEQDHRFIKRLVRAGLGFCSFLTAWRTLRGYETMHMIRKGQVQAGGVQAQVKFVDSLFGLAA